MMDNGKMMKEMALGNINIQIKMCMKDNLVTDCVMAMENTYTS